jgi:hypothetical protein
MSWYVINPKSVKKKVRDYVIGASLLSLTFVSGLAAHGLWNRFSDEWVFVNDMKKLEKVIDEYPKVVDGQTKDKYEEEARGLIEKSRKRRFFGSKEEIINPLEDKLNQGVGIHYAWQLNHLINIQEDHDAALAYLEDNLEKFSLSNKEDMLGIRNEQRFRRRINEINPEKILANAEKKSGKDRMRDYKMAEGILKRTGKDVSEVQHRIISYCLETILDDLMESEYFYNFKTRIEKGQLKEKLAFDAKKFYPEAKKAIKAVSDVTYNIDGKRITYLFERIEYLLRWADEKDVDKHMDEFYGICFSSMEKAICSKKITNSIKIKTIEFTKELSKKYSDQPGFKIHELYIMAAGSCTDIDDDLLEILKRAYLHTERLDGQEKDLSLETIADYYAGAVVAQDAQISDQDKFSCLAIAEGIYHRLGKEDKISFFKGVKKDFLESLEKKDEKPEEKK